MIGTSVLSYNGPLSFSTIDHLLSELKLAAQEHEISFRVYKKLISIMIEALENITKYSDHVKVNEDVPASFAPSLQINRDTNSIELVTCNPVKKKDVDGLRNRIDEVNSREGDELNEYYKQTLTNGEFSKKGGAGLGFIEMAKTTGNKLEYSFKDLSRDYDLYTFRAVVNL
jgi:uncharacterized protein with LGFP repeats